MSRDPAELYKDKIEVSLDGRQIFYLFFGGAVIVGLVFVLGVMVGRRVEARGHLDHGRTASASDPLAALDRLEGNAGMSFQGALSGDPAAAGSEVERAIEELAPQRKKPAASEPAATAVKPEVKTEDKAKTEAKPEDKAKTEDKAKVEKKADDKKPDEAKKSDDKKPDDKKTEKKPDEAKKADEAKKTDDKKADEAKKTDDKKPEAKTEAKPEAKTDKAADGKTEVKTETKSRYTLQLSSFQARAEAEAFLGSIKAAGFSASITEATVDGKGTFYRVRLGSYRSLEAANDAKSEFERASSKSASVMKL